MRSCVCTRQGAVSQLGLLLLLAFLLLSLVTHESGGAMALHASTQRSALYEDLGLATGASKAEIKKAFRSLTRQHHPDLKETFQEKEDAKAAMAKVLRAYEVLSDDKKRAAYDEMGIIPGEAPNVEEMSASELFAFYHQSSPIFSKSTTLVSLTELRRLREFRGSRVFLIHVFDEVNCKNCRPYSTAWETMYQSSLVDAGVLEMYRIDALSEEGKVLLTELGIRYRKEPYVIAIVDGEVWTLYSLADALKQHNGHLLFRNLLEFVMSFFYDVVQQITALEVSQLEDLLTYLRAPRSAQQPVRVLLPNINAESIPVALQLRYEQAAIRSVPRHVLLEFVEDYCEMEVDVKDRFGESIPMAEFLIVSTEALPTPSQMVGGEAGNGNSNNGDETTDPLAKKSCRLVHVGAAVALNYGKASQFLESHLPERHIGMQKLTYAGAMDFLQVCRVNCLVWVREDCGEAPNAHLIELLSQDYLSFKTGYWCMNEETKLAQVLSASGIWTSTSKYLTASPSAFVAFTGGNDSIAYQLTSLQATAPDDLTAEDIYSALSSVVGDGDVSDGVDTKKSKTLLIQGRLSHPVASLLATNGFPLSYKQRLYMLAMNLYSFVAPFASNTWPILMMYLVHRFVLNRHKPKEEEEREEKKAETAAAPTAPARRRIRKPQPRVGPYNPLDLKWAKEEKGFLLFLVEDGATAGSLPLPRLAMEDPFTVRVLGTGQGKWRQWMLEHKPAVSEGASDDLPEAERHISLMAIRKTRMKALVKSDAQSIDEFLRDLLDGTKNPSQDLPSWALEE